MAQGSREEVAGKLYKKSGISNATELGRNGPVRGSKEYSPTWARSRRKSARISYSRIGLKTNPSRKCIWDLEMSTNIDDDFEDYVGQESLFWGRSNTK